MSAREKLHGIVRAGLAVVAGGTYVGMKTGGYVDGVDTSVGVDAGNIRDTVTAIMTACVVFYPQLRKYQTFWRSLTNDDRVQQLEQQVAELQKQLKPSAPAAAAKTVNL